MTHQEIWQAVLGDMEVTLSRANFITWFKNTFISTIDDGRVIIGVPNIFTKSWLENKYNKEIATALENVLKNKITGILYKVELNQHDSPAASPTNHDAAVFASAQTSLNNHSEKPYTVNRFGLNTNYVFENFVVGKNNQLAHAACRAVAANPGTTYNPLFIYGGVGLGKTHLLHAIGNDLASQNKKILYVTCEKFTNDYIQAVRAGRGKEFKDFYRNIDVLMVDDIQFMGGKDGTQEEFFHTFNELHQSNRQIIVSSDRQPKAIQSLEARLQSRFEWGMIVDVTLPDIETRAAILEAKCKEKNYTLTEEIINHIAEVVQSNIRELEGVLNRVVAHHQFKHMDPSLDMTKEILAGITNNYQSKSISPKVIIEVVSRFYDAEIADLLGKSRKKELVGPRQVAMFLMRKEINTSFPTIGNEFGGRDHTTAIHACNKIGEEVKNDQRKKQEIESIKQLLYSI